MIEVFNYVDEHNDENFNDFEEEFVNDEIIEVADRIELHPPIPHNSIHCPPLEDTDDGFNMTFNNDTCNCYTYGANFEPCCRLWGENSEINWTSVRAEVQLTSVRSINYLPVVIVGHLKILIHKRCSKVYARRI